MQKVVPILFTLCCFLGSNSILSAADFTVKGKISFIQEAVPLPFYDVNIADGEGKYVKTVKTGFTGNYNHTFDIPDDEEVQFEVTVIDQCTGEALIVAFEKMGNQEVVNIIACPQNIGLGDNDEEEEEEEEENDNSGGLPDFINCEALGLDIPVCTTDEDGEILEFASACAAFDAGIKLQDLNFCDDLPEVGDIGGGLMENLNCSQLGVDLPINVCVTNQEGDNLTIPLCLALEEGYPLSQIEFCEGGNLGDLGSLIDLDSLDCESLGITLPICGTDENGAEITFDNPCQALDAGLALDELNLCNGILEGGDLGDLLGFDCESLGLSDLAIPVCTTNEAGEQIELPLCDALSQGLSFDNVTICEGALDSLDCSNLPIDLPVCAIDSDGNQLNFATPCDALAAGIGLHELTLCDGLAGVLDNVDCESLDFELDIPVCTTNEAGEQVEVMLCEALTQGIALNNLELCEGALEGIDCAGLGVNLPVCATDADGNELTFDNPCDALSAGLGINELTLCNGLVDGLIDSLDCTALGIDLPISVCVTGDDGVQSELNLCDALSQGISPEEIEVCANTFEGLGIDEDDCAKLGFDVPVCVTDQDGNTLKFENPCLALAAGWAITDFGFCDNLLEDVMAAAFTSTSTDEEEVVLSKADLYPNPAYNKLTLDLKFEKSTAFEVSIQAINGNAIYRQNFHTKDGANVTDLDVSSLSAGIYVVRVATASGVRAMKFVKQ